MAQEDRGLVLRGLFLLALIGCLVAFVLTMLFWRNDAPPPAPDLGDLQASAPGWEIRYNAAASLARRGSAKVPWALFREMLDERQQMRNFLVVLPDGKETSDEAAARSNMISALRALKTWHERQATKPEPSAELLAVYAAVDKLAESPIATLKDLAEKTRATFFRAAP